MLRFLRSPLQGSKAYQFVISSHSKNVCPTHLAGPCASPKLACYSYALSASGRSGLQRYAGFGDSQEKVCFFFSCSAEQNRLVSAGCKGTTQFAFSKFTKKKIFALSVVFSSSAPFRLKRAAKVSSIFPLFQLRTQSFFSRPVSQENKQSPEERPYRVSVWECKSAGLFPLVQAQDASFWLTASQEKPLAFSIWFVWS